MDSVAFFGGHEQQGVGYGTADTHAGHDKPSGVGEEKKHKKKKRKHPDDSPDAVADVDSEKKKKKKHRTTINQEIGLPASNEPNDAPAKKTKKKKQSVAASAAEVEPSEGSHLSVEASQHALQPTKVKKRKDKTKGIGVDVPPQTSPPIIIDPSLVSIPFQSNSTSDSVSQNNGVDFSSFQSSEDLFRAIMPLASASSVLSTKPKKSSRSKPKAKPASSSESQPVPLVNVTRPEVVSDEILYTTWMDMSRLNKLAAEEGLVFKKGKFSAIEEAQINNAINDYAVARNLSMEQVKEVILAKGRAKEPNEPFWHEITKAVPQRPLIAVYHYLKRKHDPRSKKGKWTEQEDALLKSAVLEFGQKWENVSLRVDRAPQDCRDRYRNHVNHEDKRVKGSWSKEEEDQLTKIVQSLQKDDAKNPDHDIFWTAVAEKMGYRRSRQQCRNKWTDHLSRVIKGNGTSERWNSLDSYRLVHRVSSVDVDHDSEISWRVITTSDEPLAPWSEHDLRRHWLRLKRGVEGHETLPHSEIMAVLLAKYADPPGTSVDGSGKIVQKDIGKVRSKPIITEDAEGSSSE